MVDKEQKNIIIETSDFRFELKKYTPLTSLILCKITDQLKQDAEESVEKPVEIDLQKIEKEEKPEDIIVKPDEAKEKFADMASKEKPVEIDMQKKPEKRESVMMDENLLLKRYGTVSVWKPVVDFILDKVSGEFARKDVVALVSEGYKTLLKRKIKQSSADTYAGYYITYMDEDSSPLLIERCDDPNISRVVLYRRIKKPEKPEAKPIAASIYELANKAGWIKTEIPVSEEAIEKGLPYSSDEVKIGLALLVKEGKAQQYAPGKVRFKPA